MREPRHNRPESDAAPSTGASHSEFRLAMQVGGHEHRIRHLEQEVESCPVVKQGETIVALATNLTNAIERLARIETAMDGAKRWVMGVLVSSVGTLLLLLWNTVNR